MWLRALAGLVAVLALGVVRPAAGAPAMQPPGPLAPVPPGEPGQLRVFVMTMGPGDHPFFRFGHDAIWIRDEAAATDKVYNFGTFRFDSPRLIFDFLGGRLNYWLSVSSLPHVVGEYRRENRSIAIQELALTPDQKTDLQAALDVNARPENRLYKYDYFLDNCSTRVRDAVDRVAGGKLHAAARQPGRMTLRQHALRMTAQPFWLYLALDIVLGPTVDRPIDQWAEMFLPEELARGLSTGPLISGQVEIVHADRPPPLASPPAFGRRFFGVGLAVGFLFAGMGAAGRKSRGARVAAGVLMALWGLAVGFIGCFLFYVWAFTDHVVAHRNQNILICAPWAIALLVLGVGVAMGRPGATRKAFAVSAAALGAALVACALKVGIVAHQENGALIAFFVPAWAGITAALLQLRYAAAHGTTGLGRSRL
ncbi:MAG TPA: DUF4105 domain-containing protein [Polyangia bacterium]|nr:DUF4105 domain-containing protein [Polyangia bacterium]